MKKFNLRKKASTDSPVISDKSIEKNREKMNISTDQQEVTNKNLNFSLNIKNKDNTVPFNAQLNASRKNSEAEPTITESYMDKKEADFNSKNKKQITDINLKTQEYDTEHTKAFKDAESQKETAFWDKYVGVQLEQDGMPIKIKDNIPSSASQLPNNPDRFKGDDVDKMVMASIRDADAMLFHIYATAHKECRSLTKKEEQKITDINAGKIRMLRLAEMPDERYSPRYTPHRVSDEVGVMDLEEYDNGEVFFIEKNGKWLVYSTGGGGEPIDQFDSYQEAKVNYPEGDIKEQDYNDTSYLGF